MKLTVVSAEPAVEGMESNVVLMEVMTFSEEPACAVVEGFVAEIPELLVSIRP